MRRAFLSPPDYAAGSLMRVSGVCGVMLVCFVGRAAAQNDLQYKFKTGDSFRYESEFKTRALVQGANIRFEFKCDAVWTVTGVDADGKAKLTQKIGRVRYSSSAPAGKGSYDSNDGPATGGQGQMAGSFAPFMNAFTGCEITLAVDPHGAVSDLKLPKNVQAGLREVRGAPGTGESFSIEGFGLFMSRPFQPLPKGASAKGNTREHTDEFRMRSGQMKIHVKYTDEGPETREGKQLERISVKPTLSIGKGRIAPTATITSQKVPKGYILFDREAGRIVEYSLTQDVEQEVPFGVAPETQEIHSTWVVKLMDKAK